MAATLQYSLEVIGRATIERELASLERRYAQHARTMNRTAANAVAGGRAPAAGSADRTASRAAREQQQLIDRVSRSQQSLARQRTREEQAFSRAQARSAADQQRAIDRQVRSQTSLARQRVREERMVQRERDRVSAGRSEFVRSTVGGGMSRVSSIISGAGRMALATTGLAGAGLAASAVNQAVKLDEVARRLSIASRAPGEAGVNPDVLRKEFTSTALATGFAPEDIGAATSAFVAKTGDLDTARKNQKLLATVAQGSGATPIDTFMAAADLSTKLGIKSADEMAQAFAILSQQGKKGAFELKAMASEFPEVLGSAATAGVRGVSGARDIGAMMQIARDTSGSDSEASTAANAMFRQLAAKSKDIQSGAAFGGRKVQVFEGGDATKPMRSFTDVLADTISASRGNVVQLQDVFDVRGKKAIDPLITAYQSASRDTLAKGGTAAAAHEAGRAAIQAKFATYRDVPADFGEVQRDASDAMKSTSVQFEIAMTQLKDAMGSQLLPEINKLIPQLAALTPQVTALVQSMIRMVSFLAENPFTGLGLAVTSAIVFEIAKAGIGKAIGSAITALMSGTGLPGIGSTVPGMAGLATGKGMLATGAAAVGVGLAADQANSFMNENGGWRGVKNFIGVGDQKGWGFDAVNAMLDDDARRAARERSDVMTSAVPVSPGATPAVPAQMPGLPATDEANAQVTDFAANLARLNAQAAATNLRLPNRGDRPSGIK